MYTINNLSLLDIKIKQKGKREKKEQTSSWCEGFCYKWYHSSQVEHSDIMGSIAKRVKDKACNPRILGTTSIYGLLKVEGHLFQNPH